MGFIKNLFKKTESIVKDVEHKVYTSDDLTEDEIKELNEVFKYLLNWRYTPSNINDEEFIDQLSGNIVSGSDIIQMIIIRIKERK